MLFQLTLRLVCNSISGAYFVTAAQSIFANRLLKTLAMNAPNIDAVKVLGTGASEIQSIFNGEELAAVLDAYMVGIKAVFGFSMAGAAFTAVLSLAVPFKKMLGPEKESADDEDTSA
jgi:MFS transporter, DHA2 family, glioxin efflux transporter